MAGLCPCSLGDVECINTDLGADSPTCWADYNLAVTQRGSGLASTMALECAVCYRLGNKGYEVARDAMRLRRARCLLRFHCF